MERINKLIQEARTQAAAREPGRKTTLQSSEEMIRELKCRWKLCADDLIRVTNPRGSFLIDESNRDIIDGLFWWFFNDPRSCYDLNKGILLKGNKGTGKTTLIRAFRLFFIQMRNGFQYDTALNIALNYMQTGVIEGWLDGRIIAIDEIGRENNGRYYGNELNVIGYILHERYNLWQQTGICTIATTNLDSCELEDRYGDIIRDRMKEMFNHIVLPGASRRE